MKKTENNLLVIDFSKKNIQLSSLTEAIPEHLFKFFKYI